MKKLPVVQDFMIKDVFVLKPEMDIYEAINFLLENKFSGAPVVNEDHNLVGVISEKDCLRLLAKGVDNQLPEGQVKDYMTCNVVTIPPNMDIYFAAGIFLKNYYRRLPVVDSGKLIGQISRRDVLKAMQEKLH